MKPIPTWQSLVDPFPILHKDPVTTSTLMQAEIDALRQRVKKLEKAKQWRLIDSAPENAYILVHEDGVIRAVLRINGAYRKTSYPALMAKPWGDVIVGDDAKRILGPLDYSLVLRDGCCENPTHWMPLPPPPAMGEQG